MAVLKYSRQREAIKNYLQGREDHPTADMVYAGIREEFPNISLGTVYRNLTLLSDIGQIAKIRVGDGVDHFDADTSPHHHFVCKECGAVIDLTLPPLSSVDEAASAHFDGQIEGHTIYFYGKCKACCEAQANG